MTKKMLFLIAALTVATPIAAYAGENSVSCTATSDGTVECTYTHTW